MQHRRFNITRQLSKAAAENPVPVERRYEVIQIRPVLPACLVSEAFRLLAVLQAVPAVQQETEAAQVEAAAVSVPVADQAAT